MSNTSLHESSGVQWPVGLPDFVAGDKVRLESTIAGILDAARPDGQSKGQQLVRGALKIALIELIIADHFQTAYAALGLCLGHDSPNREMRKPLHTSESREVTSGKSVPTRGIAANQGGQR